jgi:hypothetical protein
VPEEHHVKKSFRKQTLVQVDPVESNKKIKPVPKYSMA